jgi:16S rRNA (cytidine1402-2'-O)-methyltransferase
MSGILYVVATPIGNLEDMTYRAVRILEEASLIAAEDTRHSRKLLDHYGIKTALISYHEHNEEARAQQLLEKLQGGQCIALISDAGTPCIADPGYRLVNSCRRNGVEVVAVPGASALIAALSVSGLPTDGFKFVGFLPSKTHGRRRQLETMVAEDRTQAFYEAPHRLLSSLKDVADVCGGQRTIAVARELTKRHEELFFGTVSEALEHFGERPVKGELVVLLGGATKEVPQLSLEEALVERYRQGGLSWKQVVKQVAKEYGLPSSDVYKVSLSLRDQEDTES